MTLTPDDLATLTRLRRALHARPELSGAEHQTAAHLRDYLAATGPSEIVEGLGGTGLALIYHAADPGPTLMFRAELDALPIAEATGLPHASGVPGHAHLCGHDGHMAILAGLGLFLGRAGVARGRVILLFQPAEETGAGARAVIADPRFARLLPDAAYAIHNMPGMALGSLSVGAGVASCASVGLRIVLSGREAHAAQPETGHSPAPGLAALLQSLAPLAVPGPVAPGFRLVTPCHMTMGAPAFGIAPGRAELWLTLRAYDDAGLAALEAQVTTEITRTAQGLGVEITRHDWFAATHNTPEPVAQMRAAMGAAGLSEGDFALPMRPSEDFGAFSALCPTALGFLGAGRDHPPLHDPAYDFPDALIEPGVALFAQIARASGG